MEQSTMARAFAGNFLGNSPLWYKKTIIGFLILNPILLLTVGPFITGWALIAEFIFTLAMALKCYPLQPGGLLAIEAIALGMASPETVYLEARNNFEVILLLVFMVAGIYFMKNLLLFVFTKMLLNIRSKILLSLSFSAMAAFLSAFLDALTVTAVLIAVGVGFYAVYHRVASGGSHSHTDHDHGNDNMVVDQSREDLDQFRAFLRSLLMHGAIGTALGGVCTMVGEPQNLLIAEKMGWDFMHFIHVMSPITMPTLFIGLLTCVVLEATGKFGYGAKLPDSVRIVLQEYAATQDQSRTKADVATLIVQGVVAVFLVVALATHIAPVGLIGLTIIVLQTAFNGIVDESRIGHAFEEALPFTALLVVFFAIVGVIHDQHLFKPIIDHVLTFEGQFRTLMFFIANGVLSAISDNVFVATVYINEVKAAYDAGHLTRTELEHLAVAINTGTNIPSVATPNGQAAFLFLLTSAVAPLIRLSYGRMVIMALPYTISMSSVAMIAVWFFD